MKFLRSKHDEVFTARFFLHHKLMIMSTGNRDATTELDLDSKTMLHQWRYDYVSVATVYITTKQGNIARELNTESSSKSKLELTLSQPNSSEELLPLTTFFTFPATTLHTSIALFSPPLPPPSSIDTRAVS
jgi:hypothetical protein